MTSRKIGVAFLGGATDSAVGQVHRVAIEMDRCFELRAGCFSRNPQINQQTGAEYGVSADRVYDSLDGLLQSEVGRIDAIVILTPTPQHHDHVLACLSAGLPVICEKALADSVDEISHIRDKVIACNGFLAVTFNYTGYPMIRELRELVRDGQLGTIEQVHIEMPQEGFAKVLTNGAPIVPQDWRLHDHTVPTVSLDLGVHTHSIVRFLIGESPLRVSAMSHSFGNFGQIVDSVSCLAQYSGNVACSMWYGKATLGYRNGLKVRLFGTKGAAEWLQENSESLVLADAFGRRSLLDRASPEAKVANLPRYTRFKAGHPAGFIEAFANYYRDVASLLRAYLDGASGETPYVFGAEDALEGLHMIEAIHKASLSQTWVDVG